MRPGLSPRASILQRPGVPLPFGNALTETIPAILVGTPGAHAADVVQVVLRRGDAPPFVIRALRDAAMFDGTVQWFRAQLPALDPGRWTDYRVEWLRAGQRIATLPADGSWLRLVGVPQGASAAPARHCRDCRDAIPSARNRAEGSAATCGRRSRGSDTGWTSSRR